MWAALWEVLGCQVGPNFQHNSNRVAGVPKLHFQEWLTCADRSDKEAVHLTILHTQLAQRIGLPPKAAHTAISRERSNLQDRPC